MRTSTILGVLIAGLALGRGGTLAQQAPQRVTVPIMGETPQVIVSQVTVQPGSIHLKKGAGPRQATVTVQVAYNPGPKSDQAVALCLGGGGVAPSALASFLSHPDCQRVSIPAGHAGKVNATFTVDRAYTAGSAQATVIVKAWLASCSHGLMIMPSPGKDYEATLTLKNP